MRDKFAMAALQGLASMVFDKADYEDEDLARIAYGLADAMMEERTIDDAT